jgi:hypothetical protein
MMNSIVVQFVMSTDDNQNRNTRNNQVDQYGLKDSMYVVKTVSMQLCEKALLGYCSFYHLLLYLKHKHHEKVSGLCNEIAQNFARQAEGRMKKNTPDLGKLLIYVMLSDVSWGDIAPGFLFESLTRNVKWFLQRQRISLDLQSIVNNSDKNRAKLTFALTQTSRNLIMFQVWFMRNTLPSLLHYNRRLGRPSSKMIRKLQLRSKVILNDCTNWQQYFRALRIKFRSRTQNFNRNMFVILRRAVYKSAFNYYHESPIWVRSKRFDIVIPPNIMRIAKTVRSPRLIKLGLTDEEELEEAIGELQLSDSAKRKIRKSREYEINHNRYTPTDKNGLPDYDRMIENTQFSVEQIRDGKTRTRRAIPAWMFE